jgi:dTDP-4-dehydrorhamnose 3,5-epimerase
MKYTPTAVAALTIVDIDPHRDYRGFYSCPSRSATAGMPPVRVVGAEPEL